MILIDSRVGSNDLERMIKNYPVKVPCTLSQLDCADFVITGVGPSGFLTIAGEVKTLDDFIACRVSRRMDDQLLRMSQTYDVRWLIVIGQWRGGRPIGTNSIALETWELNKKTKQYEWQEKIINDQNVTLAMVENYFSGPILHGVARARAFANKGDFVAWLITMYKKWQQPFPEGLAQDQEITIPLDPLWTPKFRALVQTVKGFPDIGRNYAVAAAMKWGNLYGMTHAQTKEWAELTTESRQGRKTRLGEKTAIRLVKWIRGENGT